MWVQKDALKTELFNILSGIWNAPHKDSPPWQNFHMPKLLDLKESHGKRGVTLPHTPFY